MIGVAVVAEGEVGEDVAEERERWRLGIAKASSILKRSKGKEKKEKKWKRENSVDQSEGFGHVEEIERPASN